MSSPTNASMLWPTYQIDKIVGIFTGTVFIAAPTSAQGNILSTTSKAHGLGDSAYFQGIFTTDGGTTWNDFGAQTPNLAAPNPQFQTVDAEAIVDTTNVNIYINNYYDLAHSTSSAVTVTYKIYLLAKNTMAVPVNTITTNQKAQFDSRYNYQKIALQGTTAISVASGASSGVSVTHNLGYIPKIKAFFLPSSAPTTVYALNYIITPPSGAPDIYAEITTTTVTFASDQTGFGAPGVAGNIEWRIYYES